MVKTSQTIPPDQLVNIPVEIPHGAEDDFVILHLLGVGRINETHDWHFNNKSQRISVEKLGLSVLIQTDRPIYKPGQTIRTRVVLVDGNLKPYEGKLDSVVVENPSGSVMMKWTDTPLEEGFASFDLETSVKPVRIAFLFLLCRLHVFYKYEYFDQTPSFCIKET